MRLEHSGLDANSQFAQRFHEFSVQFFSQFGRRGVHKTRPPLPARVSIQSELRNGQDFAARIRERTVHFSGLVVENPQVENLLSHFHGGVRGVLAAHRDQHHQPWPGFTNGRPINGHASARRSLDHGSHGFMRRPKINLGLRSILFAE